MIELTTLGRISIRANGTERSELPAHKQKFALLVYLAVEGPVSRDRLLAVFWPEREEEKARHSLSQALYALKRELQEDCVRVEGDTIGLSCDDLTVDITQLEAAAQAENWEAIVDLYRGPFLDQFYLPGTPEFEDWCVSMRARLSPLKHRAFRRVVEQREAANEHAGALAVARRWAELDPLEDEAQHTLIALLAQSGNRAAALEQFESYRERLRRELEVDPLDVTLELVRRIRAGEAPAFQPLAGTERPKEQLSVQEPGGAVYRSSITAEEAGEAGPSEAMTEPGDWRALLKELAGRRILHVFLVYIGVAWLAIQVADPLIEHLDLPQWVFPVLLFFLIVGLPFALILAWAQEPKSEPSPGPETLPTLVPWPRWATRVRPGHVLAVLGTLVLMLLAGSYLLERGVVTRDSRVIAPATLDPTRIAVLYFDDHSEGRKLGHIANGLTETLTHELDEVEALEVLSRNAVKPYKDSNIPLDSIVRALRVGTLVEGSVMGSEERLRVNVQLIDAATLAHLESVPLERPRGETLELLDDLAREVARLLRRQLGVTIRLAERRAGTESPQAWELVRRGEDLREEAHDLRSVGDTAAAAELLGRADSLFREAERLDSNWTEPLVLQGWVAADLARLFQVSPRTYDLEWTLTGIARADRALELEPGDAAALELRGALRYYLWESSDTAQDPELRAAAQADLGAAVAADPSRAYAWYRLSDILRLGGDFIEARHAARKAVEADAFLEVGDQPVLFRVCQMAMELEDIAEAVPCFEELRRRYPRTAAFVNAQLVLLASSGGPDADAEQAWHLYGLLEELIRPQSWAGFRPSFLMTVAAVLARQGLADSAEAVIRVAREADSRHSPWTGYFEANARLQLGDSDRALDLLRDFLEAQPDRKDYIAEDFWWRPLRADPRFKALVGGDAQPQTSN